MLKKIRERVYKLKSRLYIEGLYLNDANFQIGKHIIYKIDKNNNKITVILTDKKTKNKVAQTTVRSGKIVPVIDIKTNEVKEFFQNNNNIEVCIYKGKIIFTSKKEVCGKVIQFSKPQSISVPIVNLSKAVGLDHINIFNMFKLNNSEIENSNIKTVVKDKATNTLKLLSLFSGIGAFEKAFSNLKIPYEIVNFAETNKFASKAYSIIHKISESLNLGNVSKIKTNLINKTIDIMSWGFPCTDLSTGGKQKGFIDENLNITRSGLYYEGIRILREIKPKFSIIENVKALISKKFVREFNMILNDLKNAGYNSYWNCYNAANFELPQHRERVFIVSIRNDIDDNSFNLFMPPKSEKIKLDDILIKGTVDDKYYLKDSIVKKFKEKISINKKTNIITLGQVSNDGSQGGKVYSPQGNFPTVCACTHGYALGYVKILNKIRRLLPIECAKLMGFDSEDILECQKAKISDTQLYKMLGNSIPVKILEFIYKKLFLESSFYQF